MKAERLEDLGRIREKLQVIVDHDIFEIECYSKHSIDDFIKKYLNEDKLEDLHMALRCIKDQLHDILGIAIGDYDPEY